MHIHITDEQLAANISSCLSLRGSCSDLASPNLVFHPTLEHCDGADHSALYRVHTYPWMSNPANVLHGGMTATLLDTFMWVLCFGLYGVMTPTISITVNYALPVPLDQDIIVRARVTHTGGTSAHVTGEIWLPDDPDTLLATATGVFYTAGRR